MATTSSGASAPDSVEALKRVKATENEWDARLSAAQKERDTTLQRLREETDAAVREAGSEADKDRLARVEAAKADLAKVADRIVADGQSAADTAARGEGRRPADKKDAILAVVLGAFGPEPD
jgi:vacuolar-type H+-ATPase subunit H